MSRFDFPSASYDAWKTRVPEYDYEEPAFECEECEDTGYIYPGELCPQCQRMITLEDLEDLAVEEKQP